MTVYLVGAGPGDPGLMTARALELIAAADVIVYDRLIPPGALDGARADAELIYAGKEGGGRRCRQSEITRAVDRAGPLDGRVVVRLKGGDPFVFGRGGEEAEALRDGRRGVRGGAGRDRRRRRARLRRDPRHPPRGGQRGGVRDRARGPGQGATRRSIGRALAALPGDARLLHGRPAARLDRRRGWWPRRATSGRAGGGGRARHAARSAGASPGRSARSRRAPPPRVSGRRRWSWWARWWRCTSAWHGCPTRGR